ncbi:tetratricopeptide repeat protein [Rathayibacter sp. PhB93]|uniref:Tetratricopeptide repeat protein n=1 Tax=Rathayibacter festucae TaxID=110937 RepID=A0ABX6GVQ7_9MICO|nr:MULTISPECIES: tetratricopeptide repeat protein [Rathayibacter]QHC61612.1 tetratricopeptide repeat protein [Rathayibacter festucae]ROQ04513.1 tetratricopeptide repeat protein [Rathayibacter sp. PhB93]ROQ60505.1 tetratricopeptide repeat protein [Rathayibacter sp. PhB152]TDQ13351.1 tetratricopeptide repeat protein [Rathayibacter sp. PhB1]
MGIGFRTAGELRVLAGARLHPVVGPALSRSRDRSRLSAGLSMPSGPGLVRPSPLAQPWEAPLIRLIRAGAPAAELHEATAASPEGSKLAAVIELVRDALSRREDDRALRLAGWLVRMRYDPSADPFLRRYGIVLTAHLPLSAGLDIDVPLDATALRLLFAELAAADDPAGATAAVETLPPSTLAASTLASLYSARRRWGDMAQFSAPVVNVDAPSAAVLIRRGVALRELGLIESALEAFDRVVRPNVTTARPVELRIEALYERASTHLADGRRAPARRDLERVLAQYPESPEAHELMAAVGR